MSNSALLGVIFYVSSGIHARQKCLEIPADCNKKTIQYIDNEGYEANQQSMDEMVTGDSHTSGQGRSCYLS